MRRLTRLRRRPSAWTATVATIAVVLVLAAVIVLVVARTRRTVRSTCTAAVPGRRFELTPSRAANATTIAAVATRLGLPDHAATIALAAALQESGLDNLPGGDRDSVGLFQQRPSQGWGSALQLADPGYAATAFYRALARVPGWEELPVTEAAQRVQRSAAPDAYARWETEARALARVMTGEVAAGLTCRLGAAQAATPADAVTRAAVTALGPPGPGITVHAARGWTTASWLVAHAQAYGITEVSFAGRAWSPARDVWETAPTTSGRVEFRVGS